MNAIILKKFIALALYLVSNVAIPTNKERWVPSPKGGPLSAVVAVASATTFHGSDKIGPGGAEKRSDASVRQYTYRFEGTATFNGVICPNASVTVWLSSPRGESFKGVLTDERGNYAVELVVSGSRYEPIDWTMKAYTPDAKPVTLEGRRIVMREDMATTVQQNPIDLIQG